MKTTMSSVWCKLSCISWMKENIFHQTEFRVVQRSVASYERKKRIFHRKQKFFYFFSSVLAYHFLFIFCFCFSFSIFCSCLLYDFVKPQTLFYSSIYSLCMCVFKFFSSCNFYCLEGCCCCFSFYLFQWSVNYTFGKYFYVSVKFCALTKDSQTLSLYTICIINTLYTNMIYI